MARQLHIGLLGQVRVMLHHLHECLWNREEKLLSIFCIYNTGK